VLSSQDLRDMARRCRFMTSTSLQPSVNKQLWLWAAELADYADEIERRGDPPDVGLEPTDLVRGCPPTRALRGCSGDTRSKAKDD
jgi:hypothetical protein